MTKGWDLRGMKGAGAEGQYVGRVRYREGSRVCVCVGCGVGASALAGPEAGVSEGRLH